MIPSKEILLILSHLNFVTKNGKLYRKKSGYSIFYISKTLKLESYIIILLGIDDNGNIIDCSINNGKLDDYKNYFNITDSSSEFILKTIKEVFFVDLRLYKINKLLGN